MGKTKTFSRNGQIREVEQHGAFTGSSNSELAEAISQRLGIGLGKAEIGFFENGEARVKIQESVRGKDIYVLQSLSSTPERSVNDYIMQLVVVMDALERASARNITAVIPDFAYAKQERKKEGKEPISAKRIGKILSDFTRFDRIITIDLHAAAIEGFFDRPVDNLTALGIFADYYRRKKLVGRGITVLSPDVGGVPRARTLAEKLNAEVGVIFKYRPFPTKAETWKTLGKIKGQKCIIIDDLIQSGGTLVSAIGELVARGAKEIYLGATHPNFCGKEAPSNILNTAINELAVTDSLPTTAKHDKLVVLSTAELLARAIYRVEANLSVSELFLDLYENNHK